MVSRYFLVISKAVAAAKDKADMLASQVGHPGLAGEIRELALRDCIKPFLTQSYSCGSGKLVDSLDGLSDQLDLVVYHRKVVPPILIREELGFYPIECARYAFEVKSRLTAEEIKDSNKKFESIKKLKSFPHRYADGSVVGGVRPSTVLFAFASDILGSEIDRYMRYAPAGEPPCTVLCVLGKGYWFYDFQSRCWNRGSARNDSPPYGEFCAFIAGFMNSLAKEETSMKPFNPGQYVTNFTEFDIETRSIDSFTSFNGESARHSGS